MSEISIGIGELRDKNEEIVEDLVKFLNNKLKVKSNVADSQVILRRKEGEEGPSKTYLRVLLRKFLHKTELKEEFRVISGQENVYRIKKKRVRMEE